MINFIKIAFKKNCKSWTINSHTYWEDKFIFNWLTRMKLLLWLYFCQSWLIASSAKIISNHEHIFSGNKIKCWLMLITCLKSWTIYTNKCTLTILFSISQWYRVGFQLILVVLEYLNLYLVMVMCWYVQSVLFGKLLDRDNHQTYRTSILWSFQEGIFTQDLQQMVNGKL